MNVKTLEQLNALAQAKGLKVEPEACYYQLKTDKKELLTMSGVYSSEDAAIIKELIENLIETEEGYELKQYTHIWQSKNIYDNPEGYLRGYVNGILICYDYAHLSKTQKEPDVYKNCNLEYFGYLDNDDVDLSCKNID